MMDKQIKRRKNEHIFFSMPKMVLSHGEVNIILLILGKILKLRGSKSTLLPFMLQPSILPLTLFYGDRHTEK